MPGAVPPTPLAAGGRVLCHPALLEPGAPLRFRPAMRGAAKSYFGEDMVDLFALLRDAPLRESEAAALLFGDRPAARAGDRWSFSGRVLGMLRAREEEREDCGVAAQEGAGENKQRTLSRERRRAMLEGLRQALRRDIEGSKILPDTGTEVHGCCQEAVLDVEMYK